VDSPEMPWGKMPGQPFAKEATSFMTNLIFQKNVKVVSYGLDRERRNLGFVFLGDLNVNLELVKAGLAEVYRGRGKPVQAHLAELRLAEQEARGSQKGIWILGEKYESPVKYRERMKMKK
jgi:micrococcal nuclease